MGKRPTSSTKRIAVEGFARLYCTADRSICSFATLLPQHRKWSYGWPVIGDLAVSYMEHRMKNHFSNFTAKHFIQGSSPLWRALSGRRRFSRALLPIWSIPASQAHQTIRSIPPRPANSCKSFLGMKQRFLHRRSMINLWRKGNKTKQSNCLHAWAEWPKSLTSANIYFLSFIPDAIFIR